MKCPRCGLVHAGAEQVCRRCEIDLRTGEPRPRAVALAAPIAVTESPFARLGKLLRRPQPACPAPIPAVAAAEPAPLAHVHAHAHLAEPTAPGKPGKIAGLLAAARSRLAGVAARVHPEESPGIACVSCSQPMVVVRENTYPLWQLVALWAVGGGLLVAGIFLHLLLITGALAVAAGFLFQRVGSSHWRCSSCGMIVPRTR